MKDGKPELLYLQRGGGAGGRRGWTSWSWPLWLDRLDPPVEQGLGHVILNTQLIQFIPNVPYIFLFGSAVWLLFPDNLSLSGCGHAVFIFCHCSNILFVSLGELNLSWGRVGSSHFTMGEGGLITYDLNFANLTTSLFFYTIILHTYMNKTGVHYQSNNNSRFMSSHVQYVILCNNIITHTIIGKTRKREEKLLMSVIFIRESRNDPAWGMGHSARPNIFAQGVRKGTYLLSPLFSRNDFTLTPSTYTLKWEVSDIEGSA